jgi:SAM-dependent methyltransferase
VPEKNWICADLFELPHELRGSFDVVVEHTCLSGMPPALRPQYRESVETLLKPNGLLVGIWFVNPDLDPGEEGPPYPLPVSELDALFSEGWRVMEDYVPHENFPGREGRERVRVLRRTSTADTI